MEAEAKLGERFDLMYDAVMKHLEDPDPEMSRAEKEEKFKELCKEAEEITRNVSALDMFSSNENLEDIPPAYLKFLMLPYLLGSLWNGRDGIETRAESLQMAQVYLKDFFKRLIQHESITLSATTRNLLASHESSEGSGDTETSGTGLVLNLSDEERRAEKLRKFRERKEFSQRIALIEGRREEGTLDEEDLKELWGTILRKSALEAESQLEMMNQEKEMLAYKAARDRGDEGPSAVPSKPNPAAPPFNTFMITKTDLQKKVYGAGYPSLPIMTVDELYEQRRAAGIWPAQAQPASASITQIQGEGEADESAEREDREDLEDPSLRLQQLALDEYKDEHRRGWGNRQNRS
jgi:immunoglobulin-binding protein 1